MEYLDVIPIHHCQSFLRECCDLINSEWPRSLSARLQSLKMSSDSFPVSLVLLLNDNRVVGHVKLSEIRLKGPDVMLESMIIHRDHRKKGWGKFLMEAAEKYAERRGKGKIYLSTKGQEGFYSKLGFEVCQPIMFFGFCDITPKADLKVEIEKSIRTRVNEIDLNTPPPPPPPPLPKQNKSRPQIYKTTKTFMSKSLCPDIMDENNK